VVPVRVSAIAAVVPVRVSAIAAVVPVRVSASRPVGGNWDGIASCAADKFEQFKFSWLSRMYLRPALHYPPGPALLPPSVLTASLTLLFLSLVCIGCHSKSAPGVQEVCLDAALAARLQAAEQRVLALQARQSFYLPFVWRAEMGARPVHSG
jgi:hypothetical protein